MTSLKIKSNAMRSYKSQQSGQAAENVLNDANVKRMVVIEKKSLLNLSQTVN